MCQHHLVFCPERSPKGVKFSGTSMIVRGIVSSVSTYVHTKSRDKNTRLNSKKHAFHRAAAAQKRGEKEVVGRERRRATRLDLVAIDYTPHHHAHLPNKLPLSRIHQAVAIFK